MEENMGSSRLRVLPQIKEILVVISYGCSMRIVSCTLNQLDMDLRESGKEMARRGPPRVGTNLRDWP